jgi:hypothetical protein
MVESLAFRHSESFVMPAEAGIQKDPGGIRKARKLDSRLRGNDGRRNQMLAKLRPSL